MLRSRIIGCGAYLPEKVLSNEDLATTIDTSNDWIVERTGITRRHIAAEGELTSDLAHTAAERAILAAGIDVSELDLLVLATSTPDNTFPATATKEAAGSVPAGSLPAARPLAMVAAGHSVQAPSPRASPSAAQYAAACA